MSDVPGSDPLSHEGAWTESAYLALEPAGRRIELIDGSLLVGPTSDDRHARAVAAVRAAVQAALPEGLEVSGPVALRLSPGRILVPDLVVAARSDSGPGDVRDSSVALVVIDVVGAGNGVADRWFKPQLYAGSRIPYALLVDHDDPFAVGSMLIGGRYHEYAAAEGDGVLRLEEPFALELDLTALAAAPSAAEGAEGAEGESAAGSIDDRRPGAEQSAPADSPVRGPGGDGASGSGAPGSGAPDGNGSDGSGSDGSSSDRSGGLDGGSSDSGGSDGSGSDGSGSDGSGSDGSGSDGSGPDDGGLDDVGLDGGGSDDVSPAGGAPAHGGAGSRDSGAGDGGAENGAEPGHGRNGSATADDGPHRSHPDEDHSVHA